MRLFTILSNNLGGILVMVEGTITGPIDPITNQVMGVDIMVEAF